ncbi:lytic murein transglycosylase [Rhizobium sp. KAs_5_22]|nr:lytic murein transglycosylase [Rhizobium sp. KAs_5_22]
MASWSEDPPLPCRASPPQGGRSGGAAPRHPRNKDVSGQLLFRRRCCGRSGRVLPISPLEGEMPGRAEGGA